MVKLADKLYNLRDLERATPRGWTQERKQAYFVWAAKVLSTLLLTYLSTKSFVYRLFSGSEDQMGQ